MVISIDAVRYGVKLERTDRGQAAVADGIAEAMQEQDAEVLAPARGMMCGLLLSAALWVGVAAAARAVLAMMR